MRSSSAKRGSGWRPPISSRGSSRLRGRYESSLAAGTRGAARGTVRQEPPRAGTGGRVRVPLRDAGGGQSARRHERGGGVAGGAAKVWRPGTGQGNDAGGVHGDDGGDYLAGSAVCGARTTQESGL